MQRYAEGSRGFWTNVITGARKVETLVVDPLSAFQRGELKNFKVCGVILRGGACSAQPTQFRSFIG
jgi:hypothetical protein